MLLALTGYLYGVMLMPGMGLTTPSPERVYRQLVSCAQNAKQCEKVVKFAVELELVLT